MKIPSLRNPETNRPIEPVRLVIQDRRKQMPATVAVITTVDGSTVAEFVDLSPEVNAMDNAVLFVNAEAMKQFVEWVSHVQRYNGSSASLLNQSAQKAKAILDEMR